MREGWTSSTWGGGVEVAKKHNRRKRKNDDIQTHGKINKSLFVISSGEAERDRDTATS